MYYDLIYTRCRRGVDILRSGQPVLSDGFKVYACCSKLYKNDTVDLQFIMNTVQKKQSFHEPDFMDDAYLYAVPDYGMKVLSVFHPVPYDLSVTGDFAKRPGMYLNHAIVGSFDDLYPFEMFHDDSVWTAQKHNEAYYYEQEPSDIAPRNITPGRGRYRFAQVGEFIRDGRQEALKKAVSFLITQYGLPADKRKYIVIKDVSSENVELWISAIELAFSPRIASGISFATRMDKFASANICYVNSNGTFSQQQSAGGNYARLRAMIVGVITKDKTNSARMINDAPYVLIDGEKKEAMFNADIPGRYYDLICSFSRAHEYFSRDFLQSFDLNQPCDALVKLADAYETLCKTSSVSPSEYAMALRHMASVKVFKTDIICAIYKSVNEKLGQFLKSSTEKSLPILDWVGQTANLMGDSGAKQRISEIITKRAIEVFFTNYKKNTMAEFWEGIKGGVFVTNISKLLHDEGIIDAYSTVIRTYDTRDVLVFLGIYCALCRDAILNRDENAKIIISYCVSGCGKHRNLDPLGDILSTLGCVLQDDSYAFLLESVKTYEQDMLNNVAKYIVDSHKTEKENSGMVLSLCKALHGCGLDDRALDMIERYAENSKDITDLSLFAEKIGKAGCFNKLTKRKAYEMMDKKVNVANPDSDALAYSIQDNKPDSAKCINSAHICALRVLKNGSEGMAIGECLLPFVKQGFPFLAAENYISRVVSALLKLDLSASDEDYVLEVIAGAPDGYCKQYVAALIAEAENNQNKWESTVSFTCKCQDQKLKKKMHHTLQNSLIGSGMKKKNIEGLGKLLSDKSVKIYYESVVEDVSDIMKEQDGSVISKLFRGFRK